ncbi:MAG TPA: mevalonate kinase [Bellilinea sp.]|nr:mevalonate kinase [Bellilinea sp.]
MPAVSATAPGKIILLGEHAVVYDRPAIAVPFNGVHAKAIVFATPLAPTSLVRIEAQAIELDQTLDQLEADHPFAIAIRGVMSALGIHWLPACHIRITSTIPMAAGMGSSAAVSIALSRAVSTFLGHPLADDVINDIAYQVEVRLHGTPSGIDNTVISYARPVYFVRKHPIEFLKVHQQFDLLVADCGIAAATGPMVSGVSQRHGEHTEQYEQYFNQIADLVNEARIQLESGSAAKLGPLLIANHQLLRSLGVSVPELDRLVDAALKAGAFGAKLTGGGGGGNMIALVDEAHVAPVTTALLANGAHKTWLATVPRHEESAS